jgi:hypothetical protein
MPDFRNTAVRQVADDEVRKQVTGHDIAVGIDVHATSQRKAAGPVLRRPVASLQELGEFLLVEGRIVAHFNSPLFLVDARQLRGERFGDRFVELECIGMPAGFLQRLA